MCHIDCYNELRSWFWVKIQILFTFMLIANVLDLIFILDLGCVCLEMKYGGWKTLEKKIRMKTFLSRFGWVGSKENKSLFGFIFSITQFPSLITHHSSLNFSHLFGIITQFPSLNIFHTICGPIPVSRYIFFFQYPTHRS